MFGPTLSSYRRLLEKVKRDRAKLGLPDSVSLQLLLDEVKLLIGGKE